MNDTRDPDTPETAPEVQENGGVITPAFTAQFIGAIGDGDKPFLWRTATQRGLRLCMS
jgi:hypothetical protein